MEAVEDLTSGSAPRHLLEVEVKHLLEVERLLEAEVEYPLVEGRTCHPRHHSWPR